MSRSGSTAGKARELCAVVCGWLSLAIGLSVAAGWVLQSPALSALVSTWVATPFPVGLSMVGLGLALVAAGAGWVRSARVAALVTLTEMLFFAGVAWERDLPFGAIQYLPHDGDTWLAVDPLVLIPFGMVSLVVLTLRHAAGQVWITGVLWAFSITPLALGLTVCLGYATSRTGAETWSAYTGIAFQSAAGMVLLGCGVVFLLLRAVAEAPESGPETIGGGNSILSRLLSVFAVVLVLGMALMTALISRQYSETLLEGERNQLARLVDLVKADIQIAVEGLRDEVRFLADSAPVRRIAALDAEAFGEAEWRDRADEVAEILMPLVASKSEYLQARVLGDPSQPREWVRIERTAVSGPVSRTPDEALQDKSQRGYAQVGFASNPGTVLLSDIELNREQGRISEPRLPVLRVMCAVAGEGGETRALVVINLDLRVVFEQIEAWNSGAADIRVLNASGYFLMHPDPARAFAHEVGGQYHFSDWLIDSDTRERPEDWIGRYEVVGTEDMGLAVVGIDAIFAEGASTRPICLVAASQPLKSFTVKHRHLQSYGALLSLSLVLLGIGIVFVYARRQLAPLGRIVQCTRDIGRGIGPVELPVEAPDEAGVLARAISKMHGQVRERTEALEREVAERQRAAAALRVSEGRLQGALVGGEQVAWEWNPAARTVGWLGESEPIFGRSLDEMPVSLEEFLECFRSMDRPGLRRALEQVDGTILGPIEARLDAPDQETRHLILQARRVKSESEIVYWAGTVRDVTRERHTQQAVLQERERAEHYLELAPVMFVAMDGAGIVNLVNSHSCYVLEAAREELIGAHLTTKYVHPDDVETFEEACAGLMDGRYPYCHLECRMLDAGGGEHVVSWHNIVVRDAEGNPTGTLICGEDVTERKRIEQQVLRQRAATVLRVDILEALTRPDPQSDILQACVALIHAQSRCAAVMLWLDGDGQAHHLEASSGVLPPEDSPLKHIPIGDEASRDFLRGRSMQHVALTEDSDPRAGVAWLRARGLRACLVCPLIVGDHRFGTLAIFSGGDLTQDQIDLLTEITPSVAVGLDRRLEADVAARLKAAVDSAGESIIITSSEGVIEYVNPAFSRTTGYSFQEAVGNRPNILQHPDQDPTFFADLWQTVKRGKTWTGQLKNKRKDGAALFEEVTVSPVVDSEGNLWSIVGVQRDVTLQRKLASEMQQAQKLEALGTLAGGIAHDFNNILAAIGGYAELLRGDQDPGSQDTEDLDQILTGVNRAKELVRQILTFTRQSETQRQPLALGLVVKEVCKLLRSTLPANITIAQDVRECRGMVLGDPTNMHQILLNLATNAHHAMRERGGTLRIGLHPVTVRGEEARDILELEAADYICLTVEDDGDGMDLETQRRIFEPFFTTKKVGEGTGMGLATVHGIVQAHGGTIKCYSELGIGTSFKVYLPAIEREGERPVMPEVTLEGGTETILIVDDEEVIVGMLDRMLSRLGYRVIGTASSLEALRIFHETPQLPDLVITDQTMPNMVGKELVKLMWKKRPDLPVIISTGFSETFSEEHAKDMGFAAFLSKPVDLPTVARVVRRVLDEAQTRDEDVEEE